MVTGQMERRGTGHGEMSRRNSQLIYETEVLLVCYFLSFESSTKDSGDDASVNTCWMSLLPCAFSYLGTQTSNQSPLTWQNKYEDKGEHTKVLLSGVNESTVLLNS